MTEPTMDRRLPIALVGTERSPGLRALLREVPAPLTGLKQALATAPGDDATVLLRAAGVLGRARGAGVDFAAGWGLAG